MITRFYKILLFLIITITLLLVCFPTFTDNELLRIHFINVGYGDAILIEFPGLTNMLIDAGPKEYKTELLEYLNANYIKKIDTAIITHPHKNHFEGFYAVCANMPIDRVFINGDSNAEEGYFELLELFNNNSISVKVIRKDSDIPNLPGNIEIDILHPAKLDGNANENSIVTFLRYKKTSLLLTADVAIKQQDLLFKSLPKPKEIQIVQVPHHGGPISNNFAAFFPKALFIISTGENRWGLPYQEDLDKIKNRKVLRTDLDGHIVIETNGEILRVKNRR